MLLPGQPNPNPPTGRIRLLPDEESGRTHRRCGGAVHAIRPHHQKPHRTAAACCILSRPTRSSPPPPPPPPPADRTPSSERLQSSTVLLYCLLLLFSWGVVGSHGPLLSHRLARSQACIWLCSRRAGFITGESLTVDGGIMAQGGWASTA